MSAKASAMAGIDWASLVEGEAKNTVLYEQCQNCGHSRQWHIWGDECRTLLKASPCGCTEYVGNGVDIRMQTVEEKKCPFSTR